MLFMAILVSVIESCDCLVSYWLLINHYKSQWQSLTYFRRQRSIVLAAGQADSCFASSIYCRHSSIKLNCIQMEGDWRRRRLPVGLLLFWFLDFNIPCKKVVSNWAVGSVWRHHLFASLVKVDWSWGVPFASTSRSLDFTWLCCPSSAVAGGIETKRSSGLAVADWSAWLSLLVCLKPKCSSRTQSREWDTPRSALGLALH